VSCVRFINPALMREKALCLTPGGLYDVLMELRLEESGLTVMQESAEGIVGGYATEGPNG
jgi:hypothetical protein